MSSSPLLVLHSATATNSKGCWTSPAPRVGRWKESRESSAQVVMFIHVVILIQIVVIVQIIIWVVRSWSNEMRQIVVVIKIGRFMRGGRSSQKWEAVGIGREARGKRRTVVVRLVVWRVVVTNVDVIQSIGLVSDQGGSHRH